MIAKPVLPTVAVFTILSCSLPFVKLHAAEQAFEPTKDGKIEVKTIPAATVIRKSGKSGDYFDRDGQLFMPLFRYIQEREIAMTTPVEAEIAEPSMVFYIGSDVDHDLLESSGEVKLEKLPERLVLAVGVGGSYSKEQFQKAKTIADEWLAAQSEYEAIGQPRMIYWHGPMTPWFMKRAELHWDLKKN